MSVRLYVGNLPQTFDAKELEALFTGVGEGVRFKAVHDRETGSCRGFGFANVDDQAMAEAVMTQLNGHDFGATPCASKSPNARRAGLPPPSAVAAAAPPPAENGEQGGARRPGEQRSARPRWAGELGKLKQLLENQKASV